MGNGDRAEEDDHKTQGSEGDLKSVEAHPKDLEAVSIKDEDRFAWSGKRDAHCPLVFREVPNYRVKFDRPNFVYSFTIYL